MKFREQIEKILYDAIHIAFDSKKIKNQLESLADKRAINFAEWLDKEETRWVIDDLIIVGELPKTPTKKQLFSIYKKSEK